jgi:hypothetical protein
MSQNRRSRLYRFLVILMLAGSAAGCAQAPDFIRESGNSYLRHENLIMVPLPSAASTNQGIWMSMQGGG